MSETISASKQDAYLVWKKNAPHLYDYLSTSSLRWPSLTVEWFPDLEVDEKAKVSFQRLLTGTHTSGSMPEYISLQKLKLKGKNSYINPEKFDMDKNEFISNSTEFSKDLSEQQMISHDGEVNRARIMPQKPDVISTINGNGTVSIFDRTKHPSQPADVIRPDAVLDFHKRDGFGLSWNLYTEGSLLTAASDGLVALWDIRHFDNNNKNGVTPLRVLPAHDNGVNDVKFSNLHDQIFGTVGEDASFKLFDARSKDEAPAKTTALQRASNVLSFHYSNPFCMATGDTAGCVSVWDLRSLQVPVHSFGNAHTDEVTCLEWSPERPGILASGSVDGSVKIWDMAKLDLLFLHGGHMLGVNDISWNPHDSWMLASVADDNSLHLWSPAQSIVR